MPNGPASPADTIPIRVTVSDGLSATTSTALLTVANVAPIAELGPDVLLRQGQALMRSVTFADPGNDNWTATVDYGDGRGPEPLLLNPDKSFTLQHEYLAPGEYTRTVTVTISDDDGGICSDSFVVTVDNVSTSIALDGSTNLRITDTAIGGKNDLLTIQSDTANSRLVISDPRNAIRTYIPGASGSGTHLVTIPMGSVTGTQIIVDTLGGDDFLTVDFAMGDFSKAILYDGDTNSAVGDRLVLQGGGRDRSRRSTSCSMLLRGPHRKSRFPTRDTPRLRR